MLAKEKKIRNDLVAPFPKKKILLKDLRIHELQLTSSDVMIRKAFSSVSHYRGFETKPKDHQIANYLKINE